MRAVIYGAGAIGGTVAAALHRSGTDVVAIARGAHLDVIRDQGLRFVAPGIDERLPVPAVADPAEIEPGEDDAVLLAMKTQDTAAALQRLSAAGFRDQPVFCLQNGVENARLASRRFAHVHGVTVMMPASFLQPGEVDVFTVPAFGILDIGRFPYGVDDADTAFAAACNAANIAAFTNERVMATKYGKLLINLNNVLEATLGPDQPRGDLPARIRAEAEAALDAAGIAWDSVGADDPRRSIYLKLTDLPGIARRGGSTLQSLARGTGSVETAYLNGEIAMLGAIHGVPTPLNSALVAIAEDLARTGATPGTMTLDALLARLGS